MRALWSQANIHVLLYSFQFRKGHMFKVNFYYKDSDGTLSLSTAEEIKLALMEIIDIADGK